MSEKLYQHREHRERRMSQKKELLACSDKKGTPGKLYIFSFWRTNNPIQYCRAEIKQLTQGNQTRGRLTPDKES